MIEMADRPDKLRFGIARQYSEEDGFDKLEEYREDTRFRILDIPYNESNGACWARHLIQQLYKNETYTLQIDSHMRFEKSWDITLIDMIDQLKEHGHEKPLLTGYVSSFDPDNDPAGRARDPWRMTFDRFIPECARKVNRQNQGLTCFAESPCKSRTYNWCKISHLADCGSITHVSADSH